MEWRFHCLLEWGGAYGLKPVRREKGEGLRRIFFFFAIGVSPASYNLNRRKT
jgi:hypothetical protein